MPHIQVVPNSSTASAPGWAYVPDTGFDPSKAAIQPTGARQRAARTIAAPHETSARQNTAILKRLAELDRDSNRDVVIAVPVKHRDGAGRVARGKVQPNVRKILSSQKTFANHLADEEAAAQTHHATIQSAREPATQAKKASKPATARDRRSSGPVGGASSRTNASSDEADTQSPQLADASILESRALQTAQDDQDPLLMSYIPPMPPPEVIDDLLNAPPLPYAAARAAPSDSLVPARQFCEICGYWGRVKCMRCGARVCGLACKGVHDEGRCLKFYA